MPACVDVQQTKDAARLLTVSICTLRIIDSVVTSENNLQTASPMQSFVGK